MKALSKKTDFKALYNSTIFSNIYKRNGWGGKKGEFYSGTGSHNPFIDGYAIATANFIMQNNITRIVEIGCGDFTVTSAILSVLDQNEYKYDYTGYDVVKTLIAYNKGRFSADNIKFYCKDSCVGNVKEGDVLIVRQVLQHLNNKSIKQIVDKFKNYKYVIATEHQPAEHYPGIIRNKDQETGVSIRLRFKSAVYLDAEPFNCFIKQKLYSIPQNIYGVQASINTFIVAGSDTLHH